MTMTLGSSIRHSPSNHKNRLACVPIIVTKDQLRAPENEWPKRTTHVALQPPLLVRCLPSLCCLRTWLPGSCAQAPVGPSSAPKPGACLPAQAPAWPRRCPLPPAGGHLQAEAARSHPW